MAGAGLIAIKKRIKSVTNTKKITKAMGLVATSKFKKIKGKLEVNKKFQSGFNEVMQDILKNEYFNEPNIYTRGNGSKKKLYIVLTSDFGLCGGFNAGVLNRALEEINRDKENSSLVIVGQKGKLFLSRSKVETVAEHLEMQDVPSIKEAREIASEVLGFYKAKRFGEIHIIYTDFISTVKKEVSVKKMLPFNNYKSFNTGVIFEAPMEIEPPLSKVLEPIVEIYLKDVILNCLFNSKASEQSTRMTSMDSATKNANDLLDSLKLKFNRVRQSVITQEISEIVGGAEAQR